MLVLAGCGQTHRQPQVRTLQLTAKDNNKEFTVKPGTPIVVTLSANPGFHVAKPDPKAVRLVSRRYVSPRIHEALGTAISRFRTVEAGTRTRISLEYTAVIGINQGPGPLFFVATIHVS
jgi:hypothetical protein